MNAPHPCQLRIVGILALVAAAAFSGCSPKAKLERHVANGHKYMASGEYEAAEIEFINAQRLDPRSGPAIAALGSLYLDQGSLTKAAPRLMAARELAPDDLDARVRLGRVFAMLGRSADARTEALFVLERRKEDGEAMQLLAETSSTPEQIAEARGLLTADTAAAHVALATLSIRTNDRGGAARHTSQALERDANSASAHALQAALHLLNNEPDAAEASLKKSAELSPLRSPRRIAVAQFQLGRGNQAAARETLQALVQAAPDYLPAALLLAEVSAAAGQHDEALKLVEGVLARDPDHPEAAVIQARIHITRGENTRAIEVLEKLTAKFPDAAPMHHLLATAYLAAKDTNRANASLNRAIQLAPDHAEAIILRAALQLRAGDSAGAIPALRDLLKKQPGLARAKVLLADALRARGQADEALQVYREAIEAAPRDPQLRFFAGTLFAQLGRHAEARRSFEEALAIRPNFTTAVEQLVALDLAQNDAAAAARRAEAHVAAHPESVEALLLAARVSVAQKDTAKAESTLKRAIEVNPDAATPYMLLAQLYLNSQHEDEALANLQTATAKNPRDVSTLMLIGILQQQKGDLKAAAEAYEKLLLANPSFVPALNNLAYLSSEHFGQLDRAYELANKARELRPGDPIALDTFGWILFQRREYPWALTVLTESASKLTDNPEVQYHLGMVRYMTGDESGARSALAAAVQSPAAFTGKEKATEHLAILDIDPAAADDATVALLRKRVSAASDDPVALSRLGSILARRGEQAEALAAFESVLKAHPQNPNAMIHLAGFLLGQADGLARAFELAKNAYKIAPEDPAVMHTLGQAAFASGDHGWAASLLREAVRRSPGSADVQYDFARAAYAVGSVDDALTAMHQALRLNPTAIRATEAEQFVTLAAAAAAAPVPAEAVRLAGEVLARTPMNLPALMVSASDLEQRSDIAGAVAAHRKALQSFPRFTPALKRLAVLLARDNPPTAAALDAATKAREALPNDPQIAAVLGTIHFRRGEFPRAATLLGEAARASTASPEIHYMLGMAQKELGEKERSQASLRRALELGLSGESADAARAALKTAN